MSRKEKGWKEISLAGVSPKSSVGLTGDWKTYAPVQRFGKMHKMSNVRAILPRRRNSLAP